MEEKRQGGKRGVCFVFSIPGLSTQFDLMRCFALLCFAIFDMAYLISSPSPSFPPFSLFPFPFIHELNFFCLRERLVAFFAHDTARRDTTRHDTITQ